MLKEEDVGVEGCSTSVGEDVDPAEYAKAMTAELGPDDGAPVTDTAAKLGFVVGAASAGITVCS